MEVDLTRFTDLCEALCARDDRPEFAQVLAGIRNRDALHAGVALILLCEKYLKDREE